MQNKQPDINIFNGLVEEGFFLNTGLMEKELQKLTGEIPQETQNFNTIETQISKYVSFFDNRDDEKIKKVTDRYPNIVGPCAMRVESVDELVEHMKNIHSVSYFHYILGKKNYAGFPSLCCGKSSKNMVLSLLDAGYPNVAYAEARLGDHAYVILPFIIKNQNMNGSLIVDPTYDQLYFSEGRKNAVFVKFGKTWEYRDVERGKDFFPGIICSIDSIRKSNLRSIEGYHYGEDFFEKAFNNPVNITEKNKNL